MVVVVLEVDVELDVVLVEVLVEVEVVLEEVVEVVEEVEEVEVLLVQVNADSNKLNSGICLSAFLRYYYCRSTRCRTSTVQCNLI